MRTLLYLTLPVLSLTLASCTAVNSSSRAEKQQVEISLHKMRTEVEELRHDLNTQQMQLGIYEGKLVHIDDNIAALKADASEKQKSTLEEIEYHIDTIEKKLEKFEGKQKEILSDLSQLENHANHTIKALGQYKERIKDFEQTLTFHNEVISEVSKLKNHFKDMSAGHAKRATESYTVKSGDSLQRIARSYETSIEELKELNGMNDDLIIVGQELIVPCMN